MASTTVSGSDAASWLNLRTDMAQTPVSRLGKMFRMTRLPFKLLRESVPRSVLTSRNRAAAPVAMKSERCTGMSLNFVVAIVFLF